MKRLSQYVKGRQSNAAHLSLFLLLAKQTPVALPCVEKLLCWDEVKWDHLPQYSGDVSAAVLVVMMVIVMMMMIYTFHDSPNKS
ncbi:hypothetical protein E2C01_088354 [Portunus trituberculatus]|uniref:Uncharacterized protein n=1 Tax=Portunus trituberculatus TaxID=210409 RepID=A0A5B7J5Y6_PORTR|nr:hypothetical protein [Portunus trituberculatus]